MSKKGKHWKLDEVSLLLSFAADVLPRGSNDWKTVASRYNTERVANYTHLPDRDADSLKSKFKTLKNTREPTGDPTCSPDVLRAKLIRRDIETRINGATLDDGSDEDEDNEIE